MTWLQKLHRDRCARKEALPNAGVADKLAQRASEKSGELIISYECFDCGMWHIGHADESQIAAHIPPDPTCVYCHKPIPEDRLAKAKRQGIKITTCSKRCTKILETRRAERGSKGS